MKRMHPEDPRVTAHALGELSRREASELERAALLNPSVHETLEETRQLADLLEAVLADKRLVLGEERREAIRQAGRQPAGQELIAANRRRRWGRGMAVTAAAAALVVGGVWILQQITVTRIRESGAVAGTEEGAADAAMRILMSPVEHPVPAARSMQDPPLSPGDPIPPGTESDNPQYQQLKRLLHEDPDAFLRSVRQATRDASMGNLAKLPDLVDNKYVSAMEESRAVVPMVSGRASFPLVERFVRGEEKLPPRNAVRVEELINHVVYHDDGDSELRGIRLGAELVRCPWDERRLLLGVLLRNDSAGMLPVSSALQLDLKPELVRSYRLVGYAEAGTEGGTEGGSGSTALRGLPPGWSNYVIYELTPAKQEVFMEHWVMVRVGLVVGQGEEGGSMMVPAMSPPRDWRNASSNFKTASVLAAYGMVLRDSPYKAGLTPPLMKDLAEQALNEASEEGLQLRDALQLVIDSEDLLIAAGR